ncbi:MAG: hypothetical protein Q8J89_00585 [Caulobacter sp.]|nr:hypothetical protein [Caulobacter sp.]
MSLIARSICAVVMLAYCAPAAAQTQAPLKAVCAWRDKAQSNPPSYFLWRDEKGAFTARAGYDIQMKGDGAGLFSKYGNQSLGVELSGPVVAGKPKLTLVSFEARTMIDKARSRPFGSLRIGISAGALKLGPYPIVAYAYQLDQYSLSLHATEIGPGLSPLRPAEAKVLLTHLEKKTPVLLTVLQDGAEIGRMTFDTSAFEPVAREARTWITANAAAYAATGRCADPKYDYKS